MTKPYTAAENRLSHRSDAALMVEEFHDKFGLDKRVKPVSNAHEVHSKTADLRVDLLIEETYE
jgi:hypothetical protein